MKIKRKGEKRVKNAYAFVCWGISPPVQLVRDSAAMATGKAITAKMSVRRLADMIVLLASLCL